MLGNMNFTILNRVGAAKLGIDYSRLESRSQRDHTNT